MPVFQVRNGKAHQLDVAEFNSEKELHQFFEDNLEALLSIRLVAREYEISSKSGLIDTLGIDESNRPVIIEYKLGIAGDEVLTQGLAYQSRLKNNRKHINLLVNQKRNVEVDWQLTRLVFIAKDFSQRMRDAIEELQGVDLIRYTCIEDGLIVLDKVSGQHTWRKKEGATGSERVAIEGIERYLTQTTQELHKPFHRLRARILNLSGIEEVIQPKVGITYRTIQAVARFEFGKRYINLLLKSGASGNDPDGRLRDITSYGWGFPFEFRLTMPEDEDYAFNLLQAAYQATT